MSSLEIRNLSKSFNDTPVLKNINLTIDKKEFVALLGASGSGKSTLLRIIAGLEKQDSGDVIINGKTVNNLPPKDRNVSFVFQNYALYPHMTVYDNMAFSLKMQKIPKEEVKKKVIAMAELLQISELLNRKPATLSGGQKQRVAVGRALIRKLQILLMDEPFSNIDADLKNDLMDKLLAIYHAYNIPVIYVTHDKCEAEKLSSRCIKLNDGRIDT